MSVIKLFRKNKGHFLKWLLFLFIAFISYNYVGILIILNIVILLKFIRKAKQLTFCKYVSVALIYCFLWHLGGMGWLISADKGIYGLIISTFIYLIPYILYYIVSKFYFKTYIFLIIFLLFEIFLNSLSSSNPILTIGNVLGNQIYLSQWYSHTTVIGGSFWLLILSYLINQYLYSAKKPNKKTILFILILPITISLHIFFTKNDPPTQKIGLDKVVVFNPEFYNGKIDNTNLALYLYKKLKNTDATFLILPEGILKFESENFVNSFDLSLIHI